MTPSLSNLSPNHYELIRKGGLIFAAVIFALGVAIILSKKGKQKRHFGISSSRYQLPDIVQKPLRRLTECQVI
uniref:FXYD domain-containing ion transport regulator n=1 Tax=Erpetoichthys calabaricus TaxID=27687 RepID=A0A8C4SNQ3_ERPCA